MNIGERDMPLRRLGERERPPRPAIGRHSVWIDGAWHSAHRSSPSTACGLMVALADHRYLGAVRAWVCRTCEVNDRRVEPELGL